MHPLVPAAVLCLLVAVGIVECLPANDPYHYRPFDNTTHPIPPGRQLPPGHAVAIDENGVVVVGEEDPPLPLPSLPERAELPEEEYQFIYHPIQPDYHCGVSKMGLPQRRVLNGLDSVDGDWPWVVYLHPGCTGSIISDRHVLSAAHCAFHFTKEKGPIPLDLRNMSVTAGSMDLQRRPVHGKKYVWRVRRVTVHPAYLYTDFTSPDVAIYELAEPIPEFDGWIGKICLPSVFLEHYGQVAHIVGWGADNRTDNYTVTYQAQEQTIPLNHPSKCKDHLLALSEPKNPMHFNKKRFICGGGRWKGTEVGDSGAPLMMNEKGRWFQVGLTSFGDVGKDEVGLFDVGAYTRVAENCGWIEDVTGGEAQCVNMNMSPPREISVEEEA